MAWMKRLKQYLTDTYTVFLPLLTLLFICRPFTHADLYPGLWRMVFVLVVLGTLLHSHQRTFVKIIAFIFAAASIFWSWIAFFHHTKLSEFGVGFFTTLFLLVCAIVIVKDVLLRARATVATLRGVVCAYFIIAFLFGYTYTMIEFLLPGSFLINGQSASLIPSTHVFSEMLYFSFVTLLTIGYGDIVAIRDIGQTAAVMEGIIGQFYIAILVARIVAMYSIYSTMPKKTQDLRMAGTPPLKKRRFRRPQSEG